MADVTTSSTPYTSPRAYAKEEYRSKLLSRQYTRAPFFGMMFKRGGGDSMLRPGATTLIGGGNLRRSRRAQLQQAGYQVNFFFQTGKSTGTKNMGVRDTVPQVTTPTTDSQDQQKKSAFIRWSKKITEVICWNTSTELGIGANSVGDAKVDAYEIGMEHHVDHMIKELWVGGPTDQTADVWNEQHGVDDVVDDNNVYAGIDRNVAGNAGFRSFRTSESIAATLDLVNRYHLDLIGSYTESVKDIHNGFDTVLLNRTAYHVVRAEAESRHGARILGGVEDRAKLGIRHEAIEYGQTIITYDPHLKNYNTGGSSGEPDLSSAGLFTCMGDWTCRLHPQHAFTPGKWVQIGDYTEGGKDALRMLIRTMYQWWNELAWGSLLSTGIT